MEANKRPKPFQPPPGLDALPDLSFLFSGGDGAPWRPLLRLKLFTNVFIVDRARGKVSFVSIIL